LLISIIEDKNIISCDTKHDVDNHNLQEAKVFDLQDTISDDNCEWETENDDRHSNETKAA